MLTATSTDATASCFAPLSVGELRELDMTATMAVYLSKKPRDTQARVIRRLAGLPARVGCAVGLTIRVDARGNVVSITRDRTAEA